MTELKPCPFCGSKDIVFGYEEDGSYCIRCNDCGVQVGHFIEYMQHKEDIVGPWNRRVKE